MTARAEPRQGCPRSQIDPFSDEFLAALIYAGADAGEVTEDEAALLVRSFLSAGLDTTVSAIALGVLAFARHPGQWQALREDPSLARNAFEEVVRIESPVMGFFRTTSEAVDLAGASLPANAKVLVFFAGANRDPGAGSGPMSSTSGARLPATWVTAPACTTASAR